MQAEFFEARRKTEKMSELRSEVSDTTGLDFNQVLSKALQHLLFLALRQFFLKLV